MKRQKKMPRWKKRAIVWDILTLLGWMLFATAFVTAVKSYEARSEAHETETCSEQLTSENAEVIGTDVATETEIGFFDEVKKTETEAETEAETDYQIRFVKAQKETEAENETEAETESETETETEIETETEFEPWMEYGDYEVHLLGELMYAEEGNLLNIIDPEEAKEAHMLCGSVVLHRMRHPAFSDSMWGVIYEDGNSYATATRNKIGQGAPEVVYEWAEELLKYGPWGPDTLVFQAQFVQGEVYRQIYNQYFCLSSSY